MSKKTIKIMSILITIAIVLTALTVPSFALKPSELTGSEKVPGDDTILKVGNDIISIIRTIGVVASVIIIMVLGIKYMMGSAEEKASYKKTMMPFLIGAVLLFGASIFGQMIYDFAMGIGK